MPDYVKKELFVRFGGAKRKGLDGEVSNGLGMSIVKQVMELHGGGVEVNSKENEGTSIILKLREDL